MTKAVISVTVILALILSVSLVAMRQKRPQPYVPPKWTRIPDDPARAAQNIVFHTGRVRRDPQSAIEFGMLAGAYLQRGRETGDIADAQRAEQAARRSLAIRTRHNAAAYNALALSLFGQHKFLEAREAANRVLAAAPDDEQASELVTEVDTEIGDYAAAKRDLARANSGPEGPYRKAVRARLLELTGHMDDALVLLTQARDAIDNNFDASSESVAWFHMRVGNILAQTGRPAEADKEYAAALTLFPGDNKTLTARARLHAGRQDWPAAIQYGEAAAAIVPTPEIIGLLADAYTGAGDRKKALEQVDLMRAMARLARAQGAIYDRQRALFDADHMQNLDEALRLASAEMRVRKDVYAYDTLAWVNMRAGHLREAEKAMAPALSQGTQDASLLYHAGVIASAAGNKAKARDFLTRALRMNPYFAPFAPAEARKMLAGM